MKMLQAVTAATLALTTALAPMAASAQGKGHGNGHANGKAKTVHAAPAKAKAAGRNDFAPRHVRVDAVRCPPGLAKKSPACVPPGQARKGGLTVGDVVDLGHVHIITDPGRYGLSLPPDGARYAVVDGRLVRVESQTGKILSIIRLVDAILD